MSQIYHRERVVYPEIYFRDVFATKLGSFFDEQVELRNWKPLLYSRFDRYSPSLVKKFYKGARFYDNVEVNTIHYTWNGEEYFMESGHLAMALGIYAEVAPSQPNTPFSCQGCTEHHIRPITTYQAELGPALEVHCNEIMPHSLCLNQVLAYQWITTNLLGIPSVNGVSAEVCQILSVIQRRVAGFNVCRCLLKSIGECIIQKRTILVLPILICKYLDLFHHEDVLKSRDWINIPDFGTNRILKKRPHEVVELRSP
ncbi:hypothetical protein FRX31_016514 [Thalictrum thalictroides]|uniref:Uncharacterized protein n=1 Tax=Thalictrum thalictroides TaxID=46969 RepID=A0A7J6WAJ2_THATH|nr:hypothetical protein FRX31_016514 [Thalictrum thalictroides]